MRRRITHLAIAMRAEAGAVSTEYGLILTFVVIVTVVAMTAFGIAVSGLFDRGTAGFP